MTHAELVASLLVEELRQLRGSVGALVQDVPHLQAGPLTAELATLIADGVDLRVAYLLPGGREAGAAAGLDGDVFDTTVERAEMWRNERGLEATIVVVASGDEPRLSSLRDFEPLGPSRLKRRLAQRGQHRFGELNEVQRAWWELLAEETRISLSQLLDYFLALDERPELEIVDQASREVHRLGLLPDPELFNRPQPAQIRRRLESNRQVLGRLQALSDRDRQLISDNIAREEPEGRALLNAAMRRVRTLRRGRGGQPPSLGEAQELLGLRRTPEPELPDGTRRPTRGQPPSAAELAANALVSDEDASLDDVLNEFKEKLANIDESTLKPVRVVVDTPAGETQAQARSDLVNLMARLSASDQFGGWIHAKGEAIEEMIRRFQGDADIVKPWTRDTIDQFLRSSESDAVTALRQRFGAYAAAREAVLPDLRALAVAPLLVAGAPDGRARLVALVEAYEQLMLELGRRHGELTQEFAGEAEALLGEILLLDTVVLEAERRTLAMLTPLHPLYVWHFAEFCRAVDDQRERLQPRDRELVASVAADDLPNFLTSLSLPGVTAETASTLPYVGRVGPLPYFSSTAEQNAGLDGVHTVARLLRGFLVVHPPARRGLRLTLLDAPDPGPFLLLLADLAEDGLLSGAHLVALRHPREKVGTDLALDHEEEDRVAALFSSVGAARHFTFEVAELPEGRLMPPEDRPSHVIVAFDQTPGSRQRVPDAEQPLQPLVAARRLQYLPMSQRVELVPAQGGPFAAYFHVAERVANTLAASHHALHQDEQLRSRLSDVVRRAQWLIFADRRVDRDMDLDALRVFTGRERDRDIAMFANDADPFRRALREVAVNYNVAIEDRQLDALLDELTQLLDAGVLWLSPSADGTVNHAQIKGVLGTLIAARWWRAACPSGARRMVISLDDPAARRWLHLSPDARRADLLCLETGPQGLLAVATEVKAVDATSAEYRVDGGRVEGQAVGQVLSTRGLLAAVFGQGPDADLVTTPARRELLRANAYRELTKVRYEPEDRQTWVRVIEDALAGRTSSRVHAQLVDVRIGVHPETLPAPIEALADYGGTDVPVGVVVLNEREVTELHQRSPTPAVTGREEVAGQARTDAEARDGTARERRADEPTQRPARAAALPPEEAPLVPAGQADTEAVVPVGQDQGERPRARLGVADGAYGAREDVFYDPQLPDAPLPNPHISITGETGSGKTQATKAILRDLMHHQGLPGLILDFKDDYSSVEYTDAEGLTVQDASFGGLPFNPLEPPIDLRSGRVAPMNHIHQLGEIVRRVYRLGDQQVFHLREAIKTAYEQHGLRTSAFIPDAGLRWPAFEAVRPILADDDHGALLGRLSPIFDLGLFSDDSGSTIGEMLDARVVVRLSQLPGDQVKNAVAEFLLLGLYNHLIRLPQPRRLRRMLVLDEAWRVTNSEWLEPLMREGRAFGLGIIVATQYPNDLAEAVAGATNTKLFFSQSLPDPLREIQRTLVGRHTGADAERVAADARGMPPNTCLLQSNQYRPYRRVTVEPYYARLSSDAGTP